MTRGDEIQQNRMMRLRIAGQAFTIFAFISGCALGWHGPVIETVENWKVCRRCCVPTASGSLPFLIVYSLTRTPVLFCFLHVIRRRRGTATRRTHCFGNKPRRTSSRGISKTTRRQNQSVKQSSDGL
jgi:hypothetical protein